MQIHSTSNISELEEFSRVHLRGLGKVILKKGAQNSIRITAQPELVDHIKYKVRAGTLEVKMKDAWDVGLKSLLRMEKPKIDVEVTFVNLTEIVQRGTGTIMTNELLQLPNCRVVNKGVGDIHLQIEADELQTELTGLGNIYLSGKAKNHQVRISGAGVLDAVDLETQSTHIVNSGIGSSKINVTETLYAEMNGIGKIGYRGNPRVQSKLNGVGSITSL